MSEVMDAIADFLEAQDALDNWEHQSINRPDYAVLMRRRNIARDELDAALTQPTTVQQAEQEPQREKAHEGPLVGDQIPVDHHATQSEQQSWWTTAILDGDKVGCTPPPPENSALASRGQEQRELDLYDEIECDLPYLFGRAAAEGHEASQRLAEQVREKMKLARAKTDGNAS